MPLSLWLGFAAAAFLIGVIPGPAVTSIVGYALGSGRRTALASVAGMSVGSVIAMTLSLAGVGAILRASAMAFMILKVTGAAYLIGLGVITLIRSRGKPRTEAAPSATIRARTAFFSTFCWARSTPRRASSSSPSPRSSSAPRASICCRRRSWSPPSARWSAAPTPPTP